MLCFISQISECALKGLVCVFGMNALLAVVFYVSRSVHSGKKKNVHRPFQTCLYLVAFPVPPGIYSDVPSFVIPPAYFGSTLSQPHSGKFQKQSTGWHQKTAFTGLF
ncbi:hypothetical protein ATANTOWER_006624 [Ataeniobius toweri]|uniref:Secreted protein n=1 Tax=Ataeniobius toweri TaxID=208326 RepID=A0ABU7C282_9TELE|nr:hypothetical protein [Ataeniobius toweri]